MVDKRAWFGSSPVVFDDYCFFNLLLVEEKSFEEPKLKKEMII